MRGNWTTEVCVGLAIAVLASFALAENPATKEAQAVTCTGKVVDEQGRPIGGAKVTLYEMAYDTSPGSYETEPAGHMETQADGAFSFSRNVETASDRYGQVVVEKEGFAIGWANWRLRENLDVHITLGRPSVLAGTVVDENDRPVADAEVGVFWLIIGLIRDQRGLGGPLRRPASVLGDRAYDSQPHRRELRQRGMQPVLAQRRTDHGSGLGIYRWVIERSLSWLHQNRRLRIRYERCDDIHDAFLIIGCIKICWRHLLNCSFC